MLKVRKTGTKSLWVFPGDSRGAPIPGTSLDRQHDDVRDNLKLTKDFVVHSAEAEAKAEAAAANGTQGVVEEVVKVENDRLRASV